METITRSSASAGHDRVIVTSANFRSVRESSVPSQREIENCGRLDVLVDVLDSVC